METIAQRKKFVLPFVSKVDNQTHAIIIDSNFESGNLGRAFFETKNGDDQRISQSVIHNLIQIMTGLRRILGHGSTLGSRDFHKAKKYQLP